MQTGISGIVYRFGEAILSGAQKCRQKSTVPQTRLPDAGVWQDIVEREGRASGRQFRQECRHALQGKRYPAVVASCPAWSLSVANRPG